MIHRRIVYALALAVALVFQITNNNYLAPFLLALLLALPVLSLLVSLPGMIGCRLSLSASPAALPRGEAGAWLLSVSNWGGLPLARLNVRLERRSLLEGTVEKKRLALFGVTAGKAMRRPADTSHCGLLEYRATRVRVLDYLGLFSLPSPLPEPARLLVEPIPADPGPVHIPDGQGVRPSADTAARKGPGEDYDLRDYRPGDPMRAVHWKLSSKWDDLIVREPSETLTPLPLLLFDRFGPPEELDAVLDRLMGFCRAFLAVQRPHAVMWLSPEGTPVRHDVTDERSLQLCLLDILSHPAPVQGPSVLDRPELLAGESGPAFHIYVSAGEEGEYD